MLKSLEEQAKLKTEVVAPVSNVSPEVKKVIDTSVDFETLKTNIVEIKTLVKDLQTEVDAYKVAKDRMTSEEKTAKEKTLEEKRFLYVQAFPLNKVSLARY